ncbi:MAG: hypothetical protein LBE33_03620 [Zoogloeaceae bacterium]|jgi:hypothetical protein|nr:hypothetical protein [Zoogloeaceae bacterium]
MQNIGTHIIRWLRRALAWLVRARLPMFTALVVLLAFTTSLSYWQTEPAVRISGLLLQVLGIAAAAVGIRDTRRMFGKPSFLEQLRVWFKAVPGLKPHTVPASGSATLSMSTSAKAHVRRGAGANPTLESRLSAAEANLNVLYERADAAESAFDKHVRTSEQRFREEVDARKEADRQLHLKIEAASTDGLHLAAVGVVWLACGVVMSTVPNELLNLVR